MTVSLARYFRTLRRAPRAAWPTLLHRWIEARFRKGAPSSAEVCVFASLDRYELQYARMASLLGHAGRHPPPDEVEFLRRMQHRRRAYDGAIGLSDFSFLTAVASILGPSM